MVVKQMGTRKPDVAVVVGTDEGRTDGFRRLFVKFANKPHVYTLLESEVESIIVEASERALTVAAQQDVRGN